MTRTPFRIGGVVVTTLFLASGCPSDTESAQASADAGTGGSGSAATMTSTVTAASTTTPQDSGTNPPVDTGSGADTDGGTAASASTTGGVNDDDSGTTGSGTCVDEDIGMAVGDAIAVGTTQSQGDNFDWEGCMSLPGGNTETAGAEDDPSTDSGGAKPGPTPTSKIGGGGPDRAAGDDYVIAWTPPATASYLLSLAGSGFDTFLSVHSPVCGSEALDCNDVCFDTLSGLVHEATMGEMVYIVVDGFNGDVGPFTLSITESSEAMCEEGGAGSDSAGSGTGGSGTGTGTGSTTAPPP